MKCGQLPNKAFLKLANHQKHVLELFKNVDS